MRNAVNCLKDLWAFSRVSRREWVLLLLSNLTLSAFRPGLALTYQHIIDMAISGNEANAVVWLVAYVGFILSYEFSVYSRNYRRNEIVETTMRERRAEILEHFARVPLLKARHLTVGQQMTLLSEDVEAVAKFVPHQLADLVFGFSQFALAAIYAISISWRLTLFAMLTLPIGGILVRNLTAKIQTRYQQRQKAEEQVKDYFINRVQNVVLLKAFSLQAYSDKELLRLASKRFGRAMDYIRSHSAMASVGSFLGSLAMSSLYVLGLWFVFEGRFSPGRLMGFCSVLNSLLWPFQMLPFILSTIATQKGAYDRLTEVTRLSQEGVMNSEIATSAVWTLEARDIAFSYDGQRRVIENVSVFCQTGDILGLAGPSGSGKSTLAKILLGLYDPQEGCVTASNGHTSYRDQQIRALSSYVPQEDSLFSGSVMDNIRLGKPSATTEEVIRAAKQANAHDFICELSAQYYTVLSELGGSLSGGQRQRIAIARALLSKRPMIVMDEPSSALDAVSESHILETLRLASEERIVVLIAHRQAMLDICTKTIHLRPLEEPFSDLPPRIEPPPPLSTPGRAGHGSPPPRTGRTGTAKNRHAKT